MLTTILVASFVTLLVACLGPRDDGSHEETSSVSLPVTSGPVKINCGGGASGAFLADTDFSGGSTFTLANALTYSNVVRPASDAVYQTGRRGTFSYTLPGFAVGSSNTIRLHFAETYWTSKGQRLFNVSINGTQVLTNFDIFVAAGGANRPMVAEFTMAPNTSGQYVIQFTTVSQAALVNGIEIAPSGLPQPTRVNAGGSAAGAFASDVGFSGGSVVTTANSISTSAALNPAPATLYQSQRQGNFSYTVGGFRAGSSNTVRLHFAETRWTAAGQRRFNVSINGAQVMTNFDIFAAGGANAAVVREFRANADSSGQYSIQFTGVTDSACVSGIEVQRSVPWFVRVNMSEAQYQAELDARVADGYRLTYVDGYTVNGATRYAAIFDLTPGPAFASRINMTAAEYQTEFNNKLAAGYRPSLVNGYAFGTAERYAAIWEVKSPAPAMIARHAMTPTQYQTEFNTQLAAGYRLIHVSGYTINGQETYAAIWEQKATPAWSARHAMTATDLKNEIAARKAGGFRLVNLSAYKVGGADRFAAIFEQSSGGFQVEEDGVTPLNFSKRRDDWYRQGFRPIAIDGYAADTGAESYASFWENTAWSEDTITNKIDKAVTDHMATNGLPSASIAFVKDGRLVYAKAYGNAKNTAPTNEAHVSSLYRIASVSKIIVAAGIMKLVEAGKLNLDSTVFGPNGILGTKYGSPTNPNLLKLTVKMLLSHTSGLPFHPADDPLFTNQLSSWSFDQLVQNAVNVYPAYVMGQDVPRPWDYSNMNFNILARVIETVAGVPVGGYEAWTKTNILAPLGITDMKIGTMSPANQAVENEVIYYPDTGSGSAYNTILTPRMDGNGGWIATPMDLVRLMNGLDRQGTVPDILSDASLQTMTTPVDVGTGYALGHIAAQDANMQTTHQYCYGNMTGTKGYIHRRADGVTYAATANLDAGDLMVAVDKIADAIASANAWPSDPDFSY